MVGWRVSIKKKQCHPTAIDPGADRACEFLLNTITEAIPWAGGFLERNITLLCTHMYTYTCNKADDHTQVPVLNCNNYRVIGITRLG